MRLKKWRLPTHYTALAALVLAGSVSADDGVPAILQFAEQYRQQVSEKPAPQKKHPHRKPSTRQKKRCIPFAGRMNSPPRPRTSTPARPINCCSPASSNWRINA
ncbi:Uncharacterised protein [Serratia fonticola]|uniref:Uncharacterized protein n=1 Tax=Serratia fonticola TaxID=47917 RepID=A0A4U9VZA6_SERFO|nr:Uncharacterised protein [Serratia fonticola]